MKSQFKFIFMIFGMDILMSIECGFIYRDYRSGVISFILMLILNLFVVVMHLHRKAGKWFLD
jgi:hypothetical protein